MANDGYLRYPMSILSDVPVAIIVAHFATLGALLIDAVVTNYQRHNLLQHCGTDVHNSLIAVCTQKFTHLIGGTHSAAKRDRKQ